MVSSAVYAVDVAGTVEIATTDTAMTVGAVTVNPGWSSVSGPADGSQVEVIFSNGQRTLVFSASRSVDGTIDAAVDEAPQATAATTAPARHSDDDHEGRDDDD